MYIKNKASKTWNFELDKHFKDTLSVAEGQKLPKYCIQFQNIEAIALFVQYGTVIKEHFFFFFSENKLTLYRTIPIHFFETERNCSK